ncbi:MAG: hypothetical protein ACREMA_09590 [Longimicrobiales bacterium]
MDSASLVSSRKRMLPGVLGLALMLSAMGSAAASAQESGPRTNFFLAPEARISKVGGGTAVASGFNTGWIINNRLILGAAGFNTNYGLEPTVKTANGDLEADFSYRGGLLGWNFQPGSSVKASVTTLIGRGKLQGAYDTKPILAEKFWVFEPMANVSLRVNRWAAVSAGAGYRFISGGRFNDVTANDLKSPTARIGVTLGGW